jgi:ribonuclease BN (tRNA processing enzyme)
MASNTETFVESYHINVGLGDSAIHVLATEGNGPQNPNLVAAVLVDGGLARDAAALNISATIKDIETRYKIKPLKFRSVVVTHWDADHWKGINKLLESEYSTHFDKGGLYNRFFHDTAAKTTVYAPSRWTGSKAQDDTGKPNKKMKTAEQGITITEDGNGFRFSFRGVSQAKAIVGSSVIGYDFFTNTKPSKSKEYSELKNFKDLIGPNAPTVGMYCVASDLEVIGLKKRPNRRNMDLESSLFNQLPTKTNQQSIAAIILWNNMHVSHFFAGDLDFWGENLLAEWLEGNLKSNKDGPNINCLKSSHHGARNSNPPKLFMVTKPKHIIFSVADHYGHPCELPASLILSTILILVNDFSLGSIADTILALRLSYQHFGKSLHCYLLSLLAGRYSRPGRAE